MPWNAGEALETELKNSFRAVAERTKQLFWFKIPDTRMLRFQAGEAFHASKIIADFIGIYRGTAFTLEAKSSRNAVSYDVTNLIPAHQVDMPLLFISAGGKSFFLFACRATRGRYRAYLLDVRGVRRLRGLAAESERKSVKWGEIEKEAIAELRRLPLGMWDLSPLMVAISGTAQQFITAGAQIV